MEAFLKPPTRAPEQPEKRLERQIQDLQGRIAALKAFVESLPSRYEVWREQAQRLSQSPDPAVARYWREVLERLDEGWLARGRQEAMRTYERLSEALQRLYEEYNQLLQQEARAARAHAQALAEELSRLREQMEESKRLLLIDTLTGLWNREGAAHLWNVIERFVADLIREKRQKGQAREFVQELEKDSAPRPVFFAFDLDAFKSLNDLLGHAVGDAFLEEFAKALRRVLRRESDIVVRPAVGEQEAAGAGEAHAAVECLDENGGAARVGGDEFYAFVLTRAQWAYEAIQQLRIALTEKRDEVIVKTQETQKKEGKGEPQETQKTRDARETSQDDARERGEQPHRLEELRAAFGVSVGVVDGYSLAKEVVASRLHTSLGQLDLNDPATADEVLEVMQALLAHNPFQRALEGGAPSPSVPLVENVAEYLRAASKELRKTIRRWEALKQQQELPQQEKAQLEALNKWLPHFLVEQYGTEFENAAREAGFLSAADLVRGTLEEAMRFVVAKRQARGEPITLEEYRTQLLQLFARPPEKFQIAQTGIELPGR